MVSAGPMVCPCCPGSVWNTPQLPLAVFSLSLPPVVHLQPVTAEYPSSSWHVFGLANALPLPQHLVGEWETCRSRWWKRSSSNSGPLCPCPAVLKLLPTSFFKITYLLLALGCARKLSLAVVSAGCSSPR